MHAFNSITDRETYKQYETFSGTLGYLSAGSGVVPTVAQMSVSPSSLSFGQQTKGTTTATPLTAALTNNDSNPHAFNVSGIQITGTNAADFTLVTGGAGNCLSAQSLASGASCTLYVTFTPTESGAGTAKVSVIPAGSVPYASAEPSSAFTPSTCC